MLYCSSSWLSFNIPVFRSSREEGLSFLANDIVHAEGLSIKP